MDIIWIYQQYGALIQAELLGSRRLKENGLESIVPGMVLLYYGGTLDSMPSLLPLYITV